MNSYKFFSNKECKYYPCHKIEPINCLFCFCPLYPLHRCKSNHPYDCVHCTYPHMIENYEEIIKELTPQNCWEALDCPHHCRMECDVFKKKKGNQCWTVKSEFCKNGKTEEGCITCKWYIYKHLKPLTKRRND